MHMFVRLPIRIRQEVYQTWAYSLADYFLRWLQESLKQDIVNMKEDICSFGWR